MLKTSHLALSPESPNFQGKTPRSILLVPVKARHTRNTCTIIIIESSRLQSCDIYTLHNTASVTEVIEMKSGTVDEKSINECFYNMFGCATKLKPCCGIVCSMKCPQSAVVLNLDMNIDERHCRFFRFSQMILFDIALNSILGKLKAKQKHLGCKKSARPRRNSIVNESATKSSDIR